MGDERYAEIMEWVRKTARQKHRSYQRQFALDCYLAGVEAVRWAGRYTMDGGDPIVDGTVAGACDRAAAAAKGGG